MSGIAVVRDLRFAVKSLRRTPGFTLIAAATLGLGVGANTSMFSVLNGYMLRPAPYAEHERLDRIYRATPQDPRGGVSPADYLELRSQVNGYGQIAAYANSEISVSQPGRPAEATFALRTAANLFPVLGARPLLGRGFRPEEETLGNHRVLVISHRYWQGHFGGDPHVVGRAVRVDGEPYTIVGVLPASFSDWRHLGWVDAFRPLALTEKEARDRHSTDVRLVGLRSAGLSHAQADAAIAAFGSRLAREYPAAEAESRWRRVPIDDSFIASEGPPILQMLIALSGLVVLIACSNLANLLLARTMARSREFALRSALGASRTQVLRPLVAESLLLAFAGGLFALLVAQWTFDWFAVVSAEPGGNGVGVDFGFDWRVLGWMLGACIFTALAFGVVPALFLQRLEVNSTLKSGSRGTTSAPVHRRLRSVLVVGQFALALVLLAGASLFARGIHEINTRRHGWEADHVVDGSVVLPTSTYPGDREVVELQRRALERLETLPGVASASFSYAMPFFGLSEKRRYLVDGRQTPQPGHEPPAVINGVSPHYFQTVGTRLLAGRAFDARDTASSPRVFIVNESMARALFGDKSPLGRRIAQAGGQRLEWGEVVGVAGDVESVFTKQLTVPFQLYQPLVQEPRSSVELAVRTAGVGPSAIVDSIRTAMAGLDPDLPVRRLEPASVTIARNNYQDGVLGSVLSGLALLGLGLAVLGIYGVVARTVAQRTGEFGIRLALGARASDITRLVLGSGIRLALVGSALGLTGALGVARLFAAFFPALRPDTALVLAGVTVLLIAIAQLACYLPARSAGRIDPVETLRAE